MNMPLIHTKFMSKNVRSLALSHFLHSPISSSSSPFSKPQQCQWSQCNRLNTKHDQILTEHKPNLETPASKTNGNLQQQWISTLLDRSHIYNVHPTVSLWCYCGQFHRRKQVQRNNKDDDKGERRWERKWHF